MADLLQAENIGKRYGGVVALKQASFSLRSGEVHALMGENGAGKSTLSKIIAGVIQPDEGCIRIDGRVAQIRNPLDAQRLGIGIIHQELDLFPHLTIGENIVIGNLCFGEGRLVRPTRIEAFCRPYLSLVGLRIGVQETLSALSIGQMQLVAIARALSMNARVILMDEPTSALFDDSVERLFERIADLKRGGVSVVYVSHKMDEIFRICDRVTVMRDGETAGTREIAGTGAGDLIRLMVGRDLKMTSRRPPPAADVLLSVEGLTTKKLRRVSFQLHRGEVLGIAGLVGAGRSELGAALFGMDSRQSGTLTMNGEAFAPRSARDAIDRGIGLLPEDRTRQGLMMQMSVLENSTLSVLARYSWFGFLRTVEEHAATEPLFKELALKTDSPSSCVSTLSGGNRQKVLLAKCLLADPEVVFLDDPARGIDIGAKQDIYRIIGDLAGNGKGILLVSSELPELLHCCDRILVLCEGAVTAVFDAGQATQENIMAAATSAGEVS